MNHHFNMLISGTEYLSTLVKLMIKKLSL